MRKRKLKRGKRQEFDKRKKERNGVKKLWEGKKEVGNLVNGCDTLSILYSDWKK